MSDQSLNAVITQITETLVHVFAVLRSKDSCQNEEYAHIYRQHRVKT